MNNSHLFVSIGFVFIFKLLLTAFQKFVLMSTKTCQYNENKSCLNECGGNFNFYRRMDNKCKSNFIFYFNAKWLPFML